MTSDRAVDVATALDEASAIGYYGIPAIHGGHWNWLITGYFFFGGISGAAAAIAGIARLVDPNRTHSLVRTATYVSFAALLPCPPLLILDLGRPARFFNMLRRFRTSSVMSMGAWGLTVFGMLLTTVTARELFADITHVNSHDGQDGVAVSRLSQLLAAACGTAGLFLAGYTGALLAATAVPLWSKRPALLAPLFLSSALSSGLAAIQIVAALQGSNEQTESVSEVLHELEIATTLTKGALLVAWQASLGETARPLNEGALRVVTQEIGVGVGVAAPLLLTAIGARLPGRSHRIAALLASTCALVGALAVRHAVVEGGRLSAEDPAATFAMTG